MRKAFLASALLLVGLVGCGGSGGGSVANSLFAGHWTGTYTTTGSQNGTADITIGTNGHVTGSGHNNTLNIDFGITGDIDNTGAVTGNLTGGLAGTLDGTLTIGGNGHLTGALNQHVNNQTITANFDLIKQ